MAAEDWRLLCGLGKKLNYEFCDRDARFDNAVNPVIVNFEGMESDDNDSSEEDTQVDETDGVALITGSKVESR
jgi:hypothetical protein